MIESVDFNQYTLKTIIQLNLILDLIVFVLDIGITSPSSARPPVTFLLLLNHLSMCLETLHIYSAS